MTDLSENALAAKVEAMYGKRLTEHDYRQLLQKKTVGEVAAYLKHETAYAPALNDVSEELIRRSQLEHLVRKRSVDELVRLFKFGLSRNLAFHLYTTRCEIEQLLLALRMFNAGSMEKYVVSFPAYLNPHLYFDLLSLSQITDYDGLLDVVRGGPYYNILLPYRPAHSEQALDMTGVEAALMHFYFQDAFEQVELRSRGDARRDLMHLLGLQVDSHNLMLAYRLKRYFAGSPEQIRALQIPRRGSLPAAVTAAATRAEDAGAMLEALRQSRQLRSSFDAAPNDTPLEWTLLCIQQAQSRKTFRFSIQPSVIVFSYITLMEIETKNIVTIIEGIRYRVPAEEILKLLVF